MRTESTETKALAANMEALHSKLEHRQIDEVRVNKLNHVWLGKASPEEHLNKLRTSYHAVQKSTNALTVKW